MHAYRRYYATIVELVVLCIREPARHPALSAGTLASPTSSRWIAGAVSPEEAEQTVAAMILCTVTNTGFGCPKLSDYDVTNTLEVHWKRGQTAQSIVCLALECSSSWRLVWDVCPLKAVASVKPLQGLLRTAVAKPATPDAISRIQSQLP